MAQLSQTARRVLFVMFAAIGVASCASTRISSMAAPEAQGRTYRHILVVFPIRELSERRTAESQFREAYEADSTQFVPSYTVFFPGRQYTAEEAAELLQRHMIDAALMISLDQAGATTSHTPSSSRTDCTLWMSSDGCVQTTTTTSGGYDISKPWASFTAQLVDVRTGKPAWTSSARTGGNAFANVKTLLKSMANKTVDQLRADGLIP